MSKSKARRTISYFTDEGGNRCARVPVAGSHPPAIIYADDLERLTAGGLSPNWKANANRSPSTGLSYVKVAVRGKGYVVIARLVAGARWREQVKYRNGDRFDLRRDNLQVVRGGMAHKDCTRLLADAYATGGDVECVE